MEKGLKQKLINEALKRHEKIYPVGNYNNIDECFTVEEDSILFWYNTEDKSTHLQVKKIKDIS